MLAFLLFVTVTCAATFDLVLQGAVVSPVDARNRTWDGKIEPSASLLRGLGRLVPATMTGPASLTPLREALSDAALSGSVAPDVVGTIQVLGGDPREVALVAEKNSALAAFRGPPRLDGLEVTDAMVVRVTLSEQDNDVTEPIGTVDLRRADLVALAAGGYTVLPVADRTGGRILALEVVVGSNGP